MSLNRFKLTITILAVLCVRAMTAAEPTQVPQRQTPSNTVTNAAVGPFVRDGTQVFLSAEFLYWYGNISNTSPQLIRKTTLLGSNINPLATHGVPSKTKDLDWEWDPGSRVALGVIFDRDGWDLKSEWTYFYNRANNSEKVAPAVLVPGATGTALGSTVLLSPWSINPGNIYTSVNAKSRLLFNQIDLVFGRRSWFSHYLSLRPFFGLRGYWTSLHFRIRSDLDGSSTNQNLTVLRRDRDRLKQKTWGVGLVGGLDSNWYFAEQWSLAAKADFALVYGRVYQTRKSREFGADSQGDTTIDVTNNYSHTSYMMLPILDLGLGVQWESLLGKNDRYYLNLCLGWENHFFIDYLYLDRNFDEFANVSLLAADGNLALSGLVFRVLFQF